MSECDVVRMYQEENRTIKDIVVRTGFSRSKVYSILKKENIALHAKPVTAISLIDEHKSDIIRLYNAGEKVSVIAERFSVPFQEIYDRLDVWGIRSIERKKSNQLIVDSIIQKYQDGYSGLQISEIYNMPSGSVYRILKENHICIRNNSDALRYDVDDAFFDIIDTEEKAYWLGFLMADGYLTPNGLGVALAKQDELHIEKFKKTIKSKGVIHEYKTKGYSESVYCRLIVTSRRLHNDLCKYGCVENKSLILKYPTNLYDKLDRHFIRGYFDGDGSLIISKGENYGLKLCGTYEFLTTVIAKLNFNIAEYNFNSQIYQSKRMIGKNNYYISYGGKRKVYAIARWLYDNSSISLDRKFSKYTTLKNIVEST